MVAVGAAQQGMDVLAVGRALGMRLLDKRGKSLLADDGIHHLADRRIGLSEGSLGELVEERSLAVHTLQITQELLDHPLLRAHREAVDDLDQELDETVDDLLPT